MGYYNDDGTELNPNLIKMPNLCVSCKKKDDPHEEILCNLTRLDQAGSDTFICYAYESLSQANDEKT